MAELPGSRGWRVMRCTPLFRALAGLLFVYLLPPNATASTLQAPVQNTTGQVVHIAINPAFGSVGTGDFSHVVVSLSWNGTTSPASGASGPSHAHSYGFSVGPYSIGGTTGGAGPPNIIHSHSISGGATLSLAATPTYLSNTSPVMFFQPATNTSNFASHVHSIPPLNYSTQLTLHINKTSFGNVTLAGGWTWTVSESIQLASLARNGTLNHNDGTMRINGGNYSQTAGTLVVSGHSSSAMPRLELLSGATAASGIEAIVLGGDASRHGKLLISGGSTLHNSGNGSFLATIGSASVYRGDAYLGLNAGSTGEATVTGTGSQWLNSGNLILAGSSLANASAGASGTLAIENGGAVTVAGTTKLHAGGTLNLQAGGNFTTQNFDFAAGTFNFSGGRLTIAGGTVTGNVFVPDGGLVDGAGHFVGELSIGSGGTVSPGFSPGTISATSGDWAGGGATYLWEINAMAMDGGTAGNATGWDLLEYDALTISATSGDPFTIEIHSLTPTDVAGDVLNFDETQTYSWLIATADSGVFADLTGLMIDASNFSNSLGGGTFSLISDNTSDLYLQFIPFSNAEVPEPASVLLWGMVVAVAAAESVRRWRAKFRGPTEK